MEFMITYRKRNGDIFLRLKKSLCGLRVGDETSMGWIVLDIHELYNGNYIHPSEVKKYVRNKLYKEPGYKKFIKFIIKQLNKLT